MKTEAMKSKRRMPWFVGKTISVKTKAPLFLIVEYETGEKRILDMERYIEKDEKLLPLKTQTGLFEKAEISLCGYMTIWSDQDCSCFLHNDLVYIYGDDYLEAEQ